MRPLSSDAGLRRGHGGGAARSPAEPPMGAKGWRRKGEKEKGGRRPVGTMIGERTTMMKRKGWLGNVGQAGTRALG